MIIMKQRGSSSNTLSFSELVKLFESLESTTSGNKLRSLLSEFFKKQFKVKAKGKLGKDVEERKNEIRIVCYLMLGLLGPEYESIDLGIAEKMMIRAITRAFGTTDIMVKQMMKKHGDLGIIAMKLCDNKKAQLSVWDVYETLLKVSRVSGSGSQEKKIKLLVNLLSKATPEESKYIVRIALGRLRLGVAAMTLLDSLAIAFIGKKDKTKLEEAYNLCTDIGLVAEELVINGLKGVEKIKIEVGRPIRMMLAQRVKKLSEIVEKMPEGFASEAKYDGERVQIHKKKNGEVIIYSRRLENITKQYPDIVENIKKSIKIG